MKLKQQGHCTYCTFSNRKISLLWTCTEYSRSSLSTTWANFRIIRVMRTEKQATSPACCAWSRNGMPPNHRCMFVRSGHTGPFRINGPTGGSSGFIGITNQAIFFHPSLPHLPRHRWWGLVYPSAKIMNFMRVAYKTNHRKAPTVEPVGSLLDTLENRESSQYWQSPEWSTRVVPLLAPSLLLLKW